MTKPRPLRDQRLERFTLVALRQAYEKVTREEIPDDIRDLIERLD